MATFHFLNVREGDCSIIRHNSGRVSVIDVCNAKPVDLAEELDIATWAKADRGVTGNFQQKRYPVNPIAYIRDHGLSSVWRYIQTHPDMDHMDGIKAFFGKFAPDNIWDTDNNKEMASPWDSLRYREEDWKFYKHLRNSKPTSNPKAPGTPFRRYRQVLEQGRRRGRRGWAAHSRTDESTRQRSERDLRRLPQCFICPALPNGRELDRVRWRFP